VTPVLAEARGGDAWALFSLAPAVAMLCALPLALVAAARTGGAAGRVREAIGGSPLASALVGAGLGVVALVLAVGAPANPGLGIPALLAAAGVASAAFVGLVAEARRLGCELMSRDAATEGVEAGSTAVGWLVLSGLPLLPFAGPLAWLYLALRGAGGSVVALLRRPA